METCRFSNLIVTATKNNHALSTPWLPHATCMLSCVRLFVTLWTVAHQAPLSMGFPRQEYWSRLPFPPPGDLPDPGIEPASAMSPALAGRSFTTEPPGKPCPCTSVYKKLLPPLLKNLLIIEVPKAALNDAKSALFLLQLRPADLFLPPYIITCTHGLLHPHQHDSVHSSTREGRVMGDAGESALGKQSWKWPARRKEQNNFEPSLFPSQISPKMRGCHSHHHLPTRCVGHHCEHKREWLTAKMGGGGRGAYHTQMKGGFEERAKYCFKRISEMCSSSKTFEIY